MSTHTYSQPVSVIMCSGLSTWVGEMEQSLSVLVAEPSLLRAMASVILDMARWLIRLNVSVHLLPGSGPLGVVRRCP